MRRSVSGPIAKFGVFAVIMTVLSVALFMVFGEVRTGSTTNYSAIFKDVSSLLSGDTVRVAGVRVGTVSDVKLGDDGLVTVTFDTDKTVRLTTGTRAAVRYLNLVGDRYLELTDVPGQTRFLPPDSVIPADRTDPALDLDLLLGGLKPVIRGLNPRDVNMLTSSLVQIFQGQEGTLNSLLSQTSSFTNALADNSATVEQLIDNLRQVVATVGEDGDKLSAAIDRLERLVSGLAEERDPIGAAVVALDNATASVAGLLIDARPPLAGTVDQLDRLSTDLVKDLPKMDSALVRAPENFRKLVRTGSYGGWIQYYLCDLTLRVNDRNGRVAVLPVVRQNYGRCSDE